MKVLKQKDKIVLVETDIHPIKNQMELKSCKNPVKWGLFSLFHALQFNAETLLLICLGEEEGGG